MNTRRLLACTPLFALLLLVDASPATAQIVIPQAGWTLQSVDSAGPGYPGTLAFDGNPATAWTTSWTPTVATLPHELVINLGAAYDVNGFRHLPRQDGSPIGRVGQYEFYVSSDLNDWGPAVFSGSLANVATEQEVSFPAKNGQYVRLKVLSSNAGAPYTTLAELNVLRTSVPTPTLTQVSPNVGGQGTVLNVTLTGANTHFTTGSVVTLSGFDVTAGPPTTSTATSLIVQVTTGASAAVGARTVTVTTGAEVVPLPSGFSVTVTVTGPGGPVGPVGPTGPAGATGTAGATGATGSMGAAGVVGTTGSAGAAGATGATGATGTPGNTGATGSDGTNASFVDYFVGTTYGDAATGCPNGGTVFATGNPAVNSYVCNGVTGAAGARGVTGPTGPAATTAAAGCFDAGGFRFKNCGNGTVTDLKTGLIWLKDAACAALGNPGGADWLTANENVAELLKNGTCGLTDGSRQGDWRLPTFDEWAMAMNRAIVMCDVPPIWPRDTGLGCWPPFGQGSSFTGLLSFGYWSSSTRESISPKPGTGRLAAAPSNPPTSITPC